MFQARWRWNLNRALVVLRFRNGRRNPPPIQRMEADDLMAAVFPQAAACQDNVAGPIEIPDHLLVRQTIDDTCTRRSTSTGPGPCSPTIEAGDGVGPLRATPPSRRCSPTRSSPPARTPSSTTRSSRTGAPTRSRCGGVWPSTSPRSASLEPEAIEQVHDEIDPRAGQRRRPPRPALLGRGACGPAPSGRPLLAELAARDRGQVLAAGGTALWCATEQRATAAAALAGDDEAGAAVLRGHLELLGITTVDELAEATTLPHPGSWPGSPSSSGTGSPSRAATPAVRSRSGWRAGCWPACTRTRGAAAATAVQPCTAQDFMRFLLRWQHVAPGTQLTGEAGLRAVIEQLQGYEAPAVGVGVGAAQARRCATTGRAGWTGSCHDGEVGWLRLAAPGPGRRATGPSAAPSKATPIAVVFRQDLGWLLAAARVGGDPAEPAVGATAEIARGPPQPGRVLRRRPRPRRPGGCPTTSIGRSGTG